MKACLNCILPDGDDAVSIGTEGIVIEIVSVSKKIQMFRVKWSTIGNSVGLYKAYGLYSKLYYSNYVVVMINIKQMKCNIRIVRISIHPFIFFHS